MSHSWFSSLLPPSSAFILLCKSQLELLTEVLQADWSGIYLTQRWGEDDSTQFLPIVRYPEPGFWPGQNVLEHPSVSLPSLSWSQLSLASMGEIEADQFVANALESSAQNQIVLPLIYEKIVIGVLVIGRITPPFHPSELTQIEKIAQTLAIACFLDQRQIWYQKQLEQQYHQQNLQRDLLDNLLHQLKNPLTALRTFGKLLLKTLLPDVREEKAVQGILQQSDRIEDLLHQFEQEMNLLTMNSISPMTPALPETPVNKLLLPSATSNLDNLEPVKIETILNPLILAARAIAAEKGIDLRTSLPADLPAIWANSPALREVLSNLIDNALKYTPEAGKVEVIVKQKSEETEQEGVEILIADTGYGIPEQDQGRVFERHYRGVQEKGEIAGTGLGLAIVKDLVEQMQGKIDFLSPNPKQHNQAYPGTIFRVWFPTCYESD